MSISKREDIRNIAIIAHVDHGKTTLVDHMLRQSGTFHARQEVAERVMDSGDLEREKGITIMAKNASVQWKDIKINIVDTPGHSDFGGEVERVLSMVDGVLLLVDAAEGPLPQTRFVLGKALQLNLPAIVVINKIDRQDARPDEVHDEILDLFIALGASDAQIEFPLLFAIGKDGIAKRELDENSSTLDPLFETIVGTIPPPAHDAGAPLQMSITALDWNNYVGRIAIGRVHRGVVNRGDTVAHLHPDGSVEQQRITKLYVFRGLKREEVDSAAAGEIIALSGFEHVNIGDSITDPDHQEALPYVNVDEPTIAMYFMVNTSPFAGREGKYVTSNKLRERLQRELRLNVALRVEETDSPDVFKVSGRGELQLAVLIETMRREDYEFAVSRPEVLMRRNADDVLEEPIEHVTADVPEEHLGPVIEMLGKRKGEMMGMAPLGDVVRAEFKVPARGLIGFRTDFLTITRGEGILHHVFLGYEPYKGAMASRGRGALVSHESGAAKRYALETIQERGALFIEPGANVYAGMVVGENARDVDLNVNVCKAKHLTGHRQSTKEVSESLSKARTMSLEQCIEWIADDELLEVTPATIRIRKKMLDASERHRAQKRAKYAAEEA